MRVGDQHQIDGRKVVDSYSWLPQAFQNKEPAGEVWINYDVFSADLQKETGVADECNAQLAVSDEFGFMRFANARGDSRMPYEPPELLGALAQSRILECLLQHEVLL